MRQTIAILLMCIVGLDAVDLQCHIGFGSICTVHNINITSRQTVTSINGQSNFNGSSCTSIDILYQVANFIPERLGRFFPNVESLEIHDSKLKAVEKKDLQQFPKLRELSLDLNKIELLPGDLFEENPDLEVFSIKSNQISHVGHNLVQPLNKLREVHLNRNKCISKDYDIKVIESLTADLMAQCPEPTQEMIANAVIDMTEDQKSQQQNLQCWFSNFGSFLSTCYASNLNIISRQIISKVNGQSDFDGSNYTSIDIHNQVVYFIPEGLGELFPNLTNLLITSSKLKVLVKKDLQQFPNLERLYLNDNKIHFLPGDLFEENPEIRAIFISRNRISRVGHNLLTPLNKLEYAKFDRNECIDEIYDKSEIASLSTDLEALCPEPTQDCNCSCHCSIAKDGRFRNSANFRGKL
jgi:Leucine-rich repeat (LRR) protein